MNGSAKPFSSAQINTYTRSPPIRPRPLLSYEHMFPRPRTATPARHALGALRLIRSFLLLEDDYDVDWEVDRDEHSPAVHPHRMPLRGRGATAPRRPGRSEPVMHVCLTPLGQTAPAPPGRRARPTEIQRSYRVMKAAARSTCAAEGAPIDGPVDHHSSPPTG